jgi:hypothetical protein
MVVDYIILAVCIVSGIIWRTTRGRAEKLDEEFKTLKEGIIKLVDTEFCKCDQKCNCRDMYLKFMENERGITLIS